MKKCPNCQATFDDNMRFCQTDGTPLVDDTPVVEAEPAFDPYATIVGTVAPPKIVEEPVVEATPEPAIEEVVAEEPIIHQTIGSMPIAPPDDVLDLPSSDPLKTMYVSETEMQAALGNTEPDIVEIPPIEETPAPAPPSFIAPEIPATPSFDAPPPSPFAVTDPAADEPMPEPAPYEDPAPAYDEAATMIQPTFEPPPSPFEPPPPSPFEPAPPAFEVQPSAFDTPTAAPVAEWTPPPAPDAGWANQEIGSNTPFQPPAAGVAGQNKTLAIISMVTGIVSVLCCSSIFLVGFAAIIMGFIARSKVSGNPEEYGGGGFALAGIITGGVSILFGALYWILVIFQVVALPNF